MLRSVALQNILDTPLSAAVPGRAHGVNELAYYPIVSALLGLHDLNPIFCLVLYKGFGRPLLWLPTGRRKDFRRLSKGFRPNDSANSPACMRKYILRGYSEREARP